MVPKQRRPPRPCNRGLDHPNVVKALAQPNGGFSGPKAEEASGPCDKGLNDPNAQEAPAPTRQWSPWSQGEGRPHAHARGAMTVPK